MARPTRRQALIKAAREGQPVQRVQLPRTTCPRCGREVWAMPSGEPRAHLRDTRPGEPLHCEIVPTMVTCD